MAKLAVSTPSPRIEGKMLVAIFIGGLHCAGVMVSTSDKSNIIKTFDEQDRALCPHLKESFCLHGRIQRHLVLLICSRNEAKLPKVIEPSRKHLAHLSQEEAMVASSSAHDHLVVDHTSVGARLTDRVACTVNSQFAILITAPAVASPIISHHQHMIL